MFRGFLILASTLIAAIALLAGVVGYAFHRIASAQKQANTSWHPINFADPIGATGPSADPMGAPTSRESASDENQSVELWAKDAILHGGVKLVDPGGGRVRVEAPRNERAARRLKALAEMSGHPITARLTNFRDNEDAAEWVADIPRTGEYEIDVAYASRWKMGGHFMIKLADKQFPMAAESTRSENSFRVVTLGKFSVKAGKTTLFFSPDIRPGEHIFLNLRSIQLIPAS